jgi:voltage-gated potassium channel
MKMRIKTSRFTRNIYKLFVSHPFTMLFCLLAYSYIVIFFIVVTFEKVGFVQAATLIMPAFLGELGEVESECFVTKISILAALLISVAFLAVITAKITTIFIEFCLKGGSIMKKVNLSNHIIICGWNFQGERILKNLLNSGSIPRRDIVVLANLSKRPTKNEQMDFIVGDPTQDEALVRAGVKNADSVVVLTDLTKQANEADAEALMIVLAVESLNRDVHTCVQIVNSSNRRHMERAHADEIICLDLMGGNLVTASAINHGVSRVVTELLTFNSGSEFYRYDRHLSDKVVGKEFSEVVKILIQEHIILIGFETDNSEKIRQELSTDVLHVAENGKRLIVTNPQNPYTIRQGDAFFLIAESEPAEL